MERLQPGRQQAAPEGELAGWFADTTLVLSGADLFELHGQVEAPPFVLDDGGEQLVVLSRRQGELRPVASVGAVA